MPIGLATRRGAKGRAAALAAGVALLCLAPAPRAWAEDAAGPAPRDEVHGISLAETMAWLEEEVEAHGRFLVEYRSDRFALRAWFAYRLVPQPAGSCRMSVELRITTQDDRPRTPEAGTADGPQSVTGLFHLRDVRLDGVVVRAWPGDPRVRALAPAGGGPVRCVKIPLQGSASRATTATEPGMQYEYDGGDVCLADAGAADRVARGVRHAARLCGARP
jgi:hypothetical protein